ncbi:hypothetical protein AAMO2058_000903200 [Amorphochlora amoebiformis]
MEAGIRPVAAISDVKGLQARRSQRQTYGSFHSDDAMSPRAVEYASLVDQMYLDDQARNAFLSRSASTDFLNANNDMEALPSCLKRCKEGLFALLKHQVAFWCALGITRMAACEISIQFGAVVACCLAPLVLIPYVFEETCWCMVAFHSLFLAEGHIHSNNDIHWGWNDFIMVYQTLGLAEAFLVGLGFGVLSGWAKNSYHAWMFLGALVAEGGAAATVVISYVVHRVKTPFQLDRQPAFKTDDGDQGVRQVWVFPSHAL